MKKCPFCAEEIQDEAVKCRYCNEFLDPKARPDNRSWYFRTSTVVIAVLCVFILALPLVWFNPYYNVRTKWIGTVLVLLVSWVMWLMTAQTMQMLKGLMNSGAMGM